MNATTHAELETLLTPMVQQHGLAAIEEHARPFIEINLEAYQQILNVAKNINNRLKRKDTKQ